MNKSFRKFSWIGLAITSMSVLIAGCGTTTQSHNTPANSAATNTPVNSVATTASQSNTSSGPTVTMSLATSANEQSNAYAGAAKFQELVSKYSNGSIKVQIYPNAQLGSDTSVLNQMQTGSADATILSTTYLANLAPDFSLLDLPFLFTSSKQANTVLSGPVGQALMNELPAKGLMGLDYWENGFRDLTNSQHPIKTMADLKGLKIRIIPSPLGIALWKALGANPTPMAFDQLYNALQQHVVDGQENPVQLIYSMKFYQVQKYLTLDGHQYGATAFVVSKVWFDGLTPSQQDAVKKAAVEAGNYEINWTDQQNQQDIALLKQQGMEVDTLSSAELAKWRAAEQPVIAEFTKNDKSLADQLFAAIKQAPAN